MDILEILKDGICKINIVVEKEEIPDNTSLMEEGILDSFGFVEFIAFIETKFGFDMNDEEIIKENFQHLSATVAFIKRKLNG